MENKNSSCSKGTKIACWLFALAHIAALTCISTALWQIWHVLKDSQS